MTTATEQTSANINEERLSLVTVLHHGKHKENNDGLMSAMEAVAYIAGEPWSDAPSCACPVISAFMRSWNDALPNEDRNILLPLIPKLVGTRATEETERRRAMMAVDWYIRTNTATWLKLSGMEEHATTLANLPEITDAATMPSLRGPLEAIQKDASAAESAAWSAARSAAWSAIAGTKAELQKSAIALVERMIEFNG